VKWKTDGHSLLYVGSFPEGCIKVEKKIFVAGSIKQRYCHVFK
jgi:hypothetical protein